MGSKKKPKMQVADYHLSLHYGVCHGPVDEIKQLLIGEKEVWSGSVTGTEDIIINKRNMLGGPKKEGGYAGLVAVLQGAANQVIDPQLARKMGPVERVPGFRGILSLFFMGHGGSIGGIFGRSGQEIFDIIAGAVPRYANTGGFYWGSNSPYIRDVWVKLFRRPKGFYPEKALIPRPGSSDFDVNPAHIIYECATNTVWGAGVPATAISNISMMAAADKLHEEGFGLSMIWTGQQSIEHFIKIVTDHIDAVFDVNPRTGLYELNLIRDDYATDDLPELTPDNFRLTRFARRAWEETVNEIIVTWRNPENEEEETVTYHDLGNIAQQGGEIVSETLDFTGIRHGELAMRVAQREGARRGAPLAMVEGMANRAGWDFMPGDVVLLTWPKLGIYRLPVRLGKVDRGAPGKPAVTISGVEDVFSLPTNSYGSPPATEWVDPSMAPFPLTNVRIVDVPFFMAAQDAGLEDTSLIEYPESRVAVMASTPYSDAFAFQLISEGVDFAGDPALLDHGSKSMSTSAELPQALVKEVTSVIGPFEEIVGFQYPIPGTILWLGADGEEHELVVVTHWDEDTFNITLQRGALDTVPKAWPAGTPVWFYDPDLAIEDDTSRSEGEEVEYQLLTKTSRGMLALADAPKVPHTVESRMTRPYRPANVRIWDTLWPGVVAGYAPATRVSWSNRNRMLETDQVYRWDFGNVSPEPGATVTIELRDFDDQVVATLMGLTGTFFDIDLTAITGPEATIRIWAERDGLRSYQVEEHTFEVAGYGMNYGNHYGGYGG